VYASPAPGRNQSRFVSTAAMYVAIFCNLRELESGSVTHVVPAVAYDDRRACDGNIPFAFERYVARSF